MTFGYRQGTARLIDAGTQENSLRLMAELAQRAAIDPSVLIIAKQITQGCASRDDMCELDAVFDAVKNGDSSVAPLRNGLRYVRDPRFADYFTSPVDLLQQCRIGACAGDCDDHAMLIVALLGALGWKVGLRAYGESNDGFSHVYAVVAFPKLPERVSGKVRWKKVLALDTTVPRSTVGWEPPEANVLTAWLE